jgi:hypothetical protein
LIGLAQAIAVSGKPVIVRPFPEMNNYDNNYCAFNSNCRRRDPSRSTLWNKRAFQRVYILMHGGTAAFMSAKLRARKMPGVPVDLPPNPYPKMTVVWNPLGIGEPPVAGNGYRDYYPGGAYHDAYGNNYYNTTGTYAWHVTTTLYKAFPQRVRPAPEAEEPGRVPAIRRSPRPLRRLATPFLQGEIRAYNHGRHDDQGRHRKRRRPTCRPHSNRGGNVRSASFAPGGRRHPAKALERPTGSHRSRGARASRSQRASAGSRARAP